MLLFAYNVMVVGTTFSSLPIVFPFIMNHALQMHCFPHTLITLDWKRYENHVGPQNFKNYLNLPKVHNLMNARPRTSHAPSRHFD